MLQDVPDELKGRADTKGEASMRGHLSAEGAEQTGSQSYVPPEEKNDKALNAAYNLLRGVTVNADVPPSTQGGGSELACDADRMRQRLVPHAYRRGPVGDPGPPPS